MGVQRATALAFAILLAIPLSFASVPFAAAVDQKLDPVEKLDEVGPAPADGGVGALADCPGEGAPVDITAGVGVVGTDPNGSTAPDCNYKLAVSGDLTGMRLRVNLTTTTDHDPYVKLNAPATVSPYDCTSGATPATYDQCIVDWPLLPGDYNIRVRRFGALSDFTATAYVEPAVNSCITNGFNVVGLTTGSAATATVLNVTGSKCLYSWSPGGFDAGFFNLTPSGTNVDVYVRKNAYPNSATYDCRAISTGTTTSDTCTLAGLTATDIVYVMAYKPATTAGNAAFNLVVTGLNGCSNGSTPVPLANAANATGTLATFLGASCLFTWAPGTFDAGVFNLTPAVGSPNVDIYVRKNAAPTSTVYDCRAILSSNLSTDSCTLAGFAPTDNVYVMAYRPSTSTVAASFNVRADGTNTCSLGTGTTNLVDSVAQAATLANIVGGSCAFAFVPAANQDTVAFTMPATTPADFDMYVKKGAMPTTSVFDCAPLGGATSTESCNLANDGVSTYYAMVRRFSGSGAFSITARSFSPCSLGNGDTPLSDGEDTTATLVADVGAVCFFKFSAPSGFDIARLTVTPAEGDVDLYARIGSRPTTTSFTCSSALVGTVADACTTAATGGDVYVMVRRVSGSGDFTIRATAANTCSLGPSDNSIADGVNVTASLTDDVGAACYFKFSPGAAFDAARATLTTDTGNFDLFVKTGSRPTTSSYTCASTTTAIDSCLIPNTGEVFVLVRRASGSGAFTVRGESVSSCSLGPGVHPLSGSTAASLLNLVNAKCLFEFAPSPADDFAQFALPATTPADFDLYVKKGAIPTTASYDCRPYLGGSSLESCSSLIEDAQSYFVMVLRFSGSGAFNVSANGIIVPTLESGVPTTANVAQGALAYWKVVVPADSTALAVAVGGDVTGACGTLAGTPEVCATAFNPDGSACALIDARNPGTCEGAYTAAADACAAANEANPGTCTGAPDVLVRPSNVDLYVRHKLGLPTTSLYDCRSNSSVSVDACAFNSEIVRTLGDIATNYTQARTAAWANCPPADPTCATNPIPTWPGVSSPVTSLVPFKGAGKYFIAVRGTAGPADYVIAAAYV